MFIRSCRCLAILAALCCSTSFAQAQMMQMTTPKFPMLMSKPVQKELKLTDEQVKKIQAKMKELMPEGSFMPMPEVKKGDGAAAGDDGAPKVSFGMVFKAPGGAGGAAAPPIVLGNPGSIKLGGDGKFALPDFKKLDEEMDKLLEPPQRDRLKQLVLQRTGLTALAQDEVAKDVGLDAEQKDLIKHIMDDHRKKQQAFFQELIANGGNFPQDKVSEFMKKHRDQTESDIAVVLSPEQKSKWEELQGTKFDFKK